VSRAGVRAALYTYLKNGNVTGVTQVYRAQPWFIDGGTWKLSSELGSGAVLFLHFMDKAETREADPASSVSTQVVGWKRVDYQVALVVLYQYLIPSASQGVAYAGDEWVAPLDATLASLEALIRADPTAGTGPNGDQSGVIFRMAQEPGDLTLPQDLPRLANGKVLSWQALHFTVTELIQA
jgi:hypothetical protein